MAISILPPASAFPVPEDYSDDGDSDGDIDMAEDERPAKRARFAGKGIVTPGESVTDDPQWMRCSPHPVSSYHQLETNVPKEAMEHSYPLKEPIS